MDKKHKLIAIIGHQFVPLALIALEDKFKTVLVSSGQDNTFLIPDKNITVAFIASTTDKSTIKADHIIDCNDFIAIRNTDPIPIGLSENAFQYKSPIIEGTYTGMWFDKVPKNKLRNRHWK